MATRNEVWAKIEKLAGEFALWPGETRAQRIDRVVREDYPELYHEWRAASPDPPPVVEVAKEHPKRQAAWGLIQGVADKLRREDPTLTEAAAVTRALEEHPEFYTTYRRYQSGDRPPVFLRKADDAAQDDESDPRRKRRYLLTDIEVDEVSLVDRGANEGAKIAFWKRDNAPAGKSAWSRGGQIALIR